MAPSGQKTKQNEVVGEYVYRKRTATKMSGTLALTMEAPVRKYRKPECDSFSDSDS